MCVLATGGGSGLNCLRGVEVFQRGCITYYGGPGAFSPRTFLKFEALKCPFPAFWALRLFVKFVFTVLVFRAKIKKSATLYGRTQHINLHDLHNCAWTVSGRISSFRKYITMAKCTAWLRYVSIRDRNSIAWSEIQTSYYITLYRYSVVMDYSHKRTRFYSQLQIERITWVLGNTTKDCLLLWNMLHLK